MNTQRACLALLDAYVSVMARQKEMLEGAVQMLLGAACDKSLVLVACDALEKMIIAWQENDESFDIKRIIKEFRVFIHTFVVSLCWEVVEAAATTGSGRLSLRISLEFFKIVDAHAKTQNGAQMQAKIQYYYKQPRINTPIHSKMSQMAFKGISSKARLINHVY